MSWVRRMNRLCSDREQTLRTSVFAVYFGYLVALILASTVLWDDVFLIVMVCLSLHFGFLFAGMLGYFCGIPAWWPYSSEMMGIQLAVTLLNWDLVQFVVLGYSIFIVATDHHADGDNKFFVLLVTYIGVFLCFFKFARMSKFINSEYKILSMFEV